MHPFSSQENHKRITDEGESKNTFLRLSTIQDDFLSWGREEQSERKKRHLNGGQDHERRVHGDYDVSLHRCAIQRRLVRGPTWIKALRIQWLGYSLLKTVGER